MKTSTAIAAVVSCSGLWSCSAPEPQLTLDERVEARRDSGPRCFAHPRGPAEPCLCDSDCDVGRCVEAIGLTYRVCSLVCSADATCGTGSVCVGAEEGSSGACLRTCTYSDDCTPGMLCFPRGYCQRWCTNDADCSPLNCDLHSGRCGEPLPGEAGVSEPCLENLDCRSGLCHESFCMTFCDVGSPACPDGTVCGPRDGVSDQVGLCYRTCATTRDCPEGLVCNAGDVGELICVMP